MRPSHSRDQPSTPGINITPLVDMVFILLIFFMVSSSFVKETGVEVSRPAARTASVQERGNILIAVTAAGEVWIERRRVDQGAVRAQVERLHAEFPEGAVVVLADRQAPAGILVRVLDQARLAGVQQVSIAAERKTP